MKRALLLSAFLAWAGVARAQFNAEGYDDYGSFATDPVDLDNEVSQIFGRFFQSSFQVGTVVLMGDLGKAYSAGVMVGGKFIFYFDKIWAAELGAGFGHLNGLYDVNNTGSNNINIQLSTNMIPLSLGIRYGFDQERLGRGLATMNPYFSVNGMFIFRNEEVVGTPTTNGLSSDLQTKFAPTAIVGTNAFGVNMGGGVEFDVYKRKLLVGVDVRYHLIFWPDSSVVMGSPGGVPLLRDGNAVTIMATATYNY